MKRATHNLGHYRVTAGDMGLLYPVSVTEVLPGDTIRASMQGLIRMQPLMTPLMHPVDISVSCFFVPNRLTWSGWEDFITGKNASATIPTIASVTDDSIYDYMGAAPTADKPVNALPAYAYNLVWNEFFRDQDLQTERTNIDTSIANVAWSKDYFTTARGQPQQGPAISIPFAAGSNAPIVGFGNDSGATTLTRNNVKETGGITRNYVGNAGDPTSGWAIENDENGFPAIYADLSRSSGNIAIEDWRRAMALQRFAEHRNKFGSRYKDYLAFLGVSSPDARLDRPEYLGGGRQTISFSEVLQTVEDSQTPLGTQGGHGIASIRTRAWRKFFTEHGYIVSLMHVRPRNMYLTAQDRTFLRSSKDDFWQKENEMLGDQPVGNREIYADGANNDAFGYSPRHDDYRTQRSYATGPMRKSAYATWHMAREFSSQPALNSDFIKCEPTKRVFRSANDPQLYMMLNHKMRARRLVAKYARN